MNFESELNDLINRYSIENESDTPDYLLAKYLIDCLKVYANIVKKRDQWFSFSPWCKGEDKNENK